MTGVVLVDAGRSGVVPDLPDLPETPGRLTEDVIEALLRRTCLQRSELTRLFLADPRCLSTGSPVGEAGWIFEPPPLGLRTTVSMSSAVSMTQAVRAIEQDPDVIAVVAATDFGTGTSYHGDSAAAVHRQQHMARVVAAWWDLVPDELADWARSSCTRSAECSAAGDFAGEIVATTGSYGTDRFRAPESADGDGADRTPKRRLVDDGAAFTAHPARGASAIILAGEANAIRLGLRIRARLSAVCATRARAEFGIAPLSARALDELLAPSGFGLGALDQLEVPEQYAVTPVAWIKETGISEYLVNPRGGDLAFGHLPRSGHLRSLVTMANSLEATGGWAGALVASEIHRTTAFVLATTDSTTSRG
ncbi:MULTISPECIES: acetyl-CoA C-acetyltransferase [unclassified Nocardia]|uniref:hypothetical protein n=1 Tax=unclassified Nocardia TaxID=2637762 RepID=UPI0033BF1612